MTHSTTALTYLNKLENIAIFGASGAIGRSLQNHFIQSCPHLKSLHLFSRTQPSTTHSMITNHHIDIHDENTLIQAKNMIESSVSFDLIIIATGALHIQDHMPEKSISQYNKEKAELFYLTNTIGPSLIMKHFHSMLTKNKPSILASLCARIGSIQDNKLGGWYSYRASKAALMMMTKSMSIELNRKNPDAICVGLHPGTVDSNLSKPFQKHIKKDMIMSPETSSQKLIDTLATLTAESTGHQFAYDGSVIPF